VVAQRRTHLTDETADARYALELQATSLPRRGAWALASTPTTGVLPSPTRASTCARRGTTSPRRPCAPTWAGPRGALRVGGAAGYGSSPTADRRASRALLLSRHPEGAIGLVRHHRPRPHDARRVLDEERSMLTLNAGRHLVVVDQVNTVAGEVLAARRESLRGPVAARAAGVPRLARRRPDGLRVIVYTDTASAARSPAPSARSGRRRRDALRGACASTSRASSPSPTRGVELSADGGRRWASCARRSDAPRRPGARRRGVDRRGPPAVAFPDGLAARRLRRGCPGDRRADDRCGAVMDVPLARTWWSSAAALLGA
jgi:hypothetical protein